MTDLKKPVAPTRSPPGRVQVITGWALSIKGLMTAIGGAALAALTLWPKISDKLAEVGLYAPAPCLRVDRPMFPGTVEQKEWDKKMIKLKVHNNCSKPPHLYVTFAYRGGGESLTRFKATYEDQWPECKSLASLQNPNCWDKNERFDKGDWEWNVHLPLVQRFKEPLPVETISITIDVYDSDAPTKPAILTSNDRVEVHGPARDAT